MEMPKARHAQDVLGSNRSLPAFSFESEDITFRWDPDIPPHGGLRTTTAGGARIELRPGVAIRPTFLGKQHRHAWTVSVNGIELYGNIWSDEQLPEPGLRSVVGAAITATEGLLLRFQHDAALIETRSSAEVGGS